MIKLPLITRPKVASLTPVTLTEHVDRQIETRLAAICQAEWKKANKLPNGKTRKKLVPVTYSRTVHDLLDLRQQLLAGVDPESIAAELHIGEIPVAYHKAKENS